MKKRGSLLKYLLTFIFIFGIAFLARIPKAYADTKHDFSFKIYNCYSLDESKLQDTVNPDTNKVSEAASFDCAGPNGDGVTPEITATNVDGVGSVYKIEPGQYIKVGIHYKPGTAVSVGQQVKWTWDSNIELIQLSKYKRATSTYYYSFDDSYQMGEDWVDEYERYYEFNTALNPTVDNKIAYSASAKQGDNGDPIELEMDIIYFYYKVKDDAATNTPLKFEFDTTPGSGIVMGNGSAYVSHDLSLYAEVPLSEDNSLKSITVTNGSTTYPVTPNVTPGDNTQTTYTAYVPNNINSINLAAEANDDPKAILTGQTGNHSNLTEGDNNFTITVTAEDGTPKDYTVNIYKLSNNANLSTLSLTNVNFGNFAAGTTSYTATVPYTTDSTTVSATVADTGKAYLTSGSTGNKDLDVGETPISVTVKAENCKSDYSEVPGNTCTDKTYTVTVTREAPSTISTLNNLLVDGNIVPGFTPGDGTSTYTLDDVGYSKQTMVITYDKGEDHESVTGDGTKTLVVGDNSFDVVVTAQDGTTKTTYTINVYKKSNNADLATLTVNSSKGGTLDPAFASNKINYTYSVDADENSVDISYTLAHSEASATTTPANLTGINPQTTSSVTIEVTPEDTTQTKKTYTITFDVAKSTNGNLSGITIDTEPLSGFQSDDYSYDITVPSTTESINVGATLEDNRANITGGTGVQTLDYGSNTIEITVQPEDSNAEPVVYTLNVTREKENVSTLNDLLVDGNRVKGFTPGDGTKTYTLDPVGYSIESVNITYVEGEEHQQVTGDGEKTLQVGDNSFDVVVTAHNGTDKTTYTIKVYKKNNNADLNGLTINSSKDGSLDKEFNSGITTYTYTTDPDETSIDISFTKADENATVVTTPAYLTNIDPRTTESVTIEVTPEDTTQIKKTYTITFNIAESSNANLSKITIDNTEISDFDPEVTEYNVTVPSNKDKIDIEAELEDGRGTISGDIGMQDVDYGENEFTVIGNAEDGTPKEYTIIVTREKEKDAKLLEFKVDGESVPGFDPADPDGSEYTIEDRSNATETVNISVITNEEHAVVSGTGDVTINVGDNKLPVTIYAHDDSVHITYYINVRRKDSDNTLKSLTITSDPAGTWSESFDPSVKTYTYTVDRDEDEVEITAEASGEKATVSGTGTYNPQTDTSAQITVTPEDGEIEIYTINFVKAKSSNADLDSLEVEGYELDPDFDEDETEYTVNVPSNIDEVNIIAHAADRLAVITGDGVQGVDYGSNQLQVVVTPEDPDADPKTYTITVIRALSDSVKLSDLTVDGDTVEGFDPDVPAYDIGVVPNSKKTILIGAEASGPVTKIEGTGTKDLAVGKQTFEVVITAQDGQTTGKYSITVEREANDDNTLSALEVEGYELDPDFDPNEDHYNITVPSDVDSVTVNATATDSDNAEVTIEGNENLQPGENTITITVKAEDGSEKEYIITVTKEDDDEKITSQIRTIADGMIKDVVYKSVAEQLKDDCDNDNDLLFIYPDSESDTEIAEDKHLGTGMEIRLIKNGRVNDSDILIVKGDVDGNSAIELLDAVIVLNHYLGRDTLEGIWFEAGDTNSDSEVALLDAVNILGIYLNN